MLPLLHPRQIPRSPSSSPPLRTYTGGIKLACVAFLKKLIYMWVYPNEGLLEMPKTLVNLDFPSNRIHFLAASRLIFRPDNIG